MSEKAFIFSISAILRTDLKAKDEIAKLKGVSDV
jgi:hypothetical protein